MKLALGIIAAVSFIVLIGIIMFLINRISITVDKIDRDISKLKRVSVDHEVKIRKIRSDMDKEMLHMTKAEENEESEENE